MPTVPPSTLAPQQAMPQPSQTDLLMALATMHEQGKLLNPDAPPQPKAKP